jgi:hypothetical protein
MPILATTDEIIPRSTLRYRPIGESQPSSGRRPETSPVVARASRVRPVQADTLDDVSSWKQGEKGSQQGKKRGDAHTSSHPGGQRISHNGWQIHPLLYLGVGMLLALVLSLALSAASGWFTTLLDDLHYGRPRTFQVDAYVGHENSGNPSHFIAINLNRRIQIIEMPGGDETRARIYTGPQLFRSGDELAAVTLNFIDVNADRKPDMLVNFQGSRVVFINDKGSFRAALPSEQIQAEQSLQRQKK